MKSVLASLTALLISFSAWQSASAQEIIQLEHYPDLLESSTPASMGMQIPHHESQSAAPAPESVPKRLKLQHAEPLYIDLIRDLGALQGEEEWNIGMGLNDETDYDSYQFLVEYEWAPIDRLGLEIEFPFTFYSLHGPQTENTSHRLDALKGAFQYTFLVHEEWETSMAVGYLHELELASFKDWGQQSLFKGNVYNPFFVAAKRWPENFHSLIYTGPRFEHLFATGEIHSSWDINTSVHYMLPNSRNFIGVEFNKTLSDKGFKMVVRPQMRLSIHDQLILGLVVGLPLSRDDERLSMFIRLIYEPSHEHDEDSREPVIGEEAES